MQFRLTLSCNPGRTLVPFNYAYRLSGFLYRVLADADEQYARWLHERGYVLSPTRRFKLFTFSDLHLPDYRTDARAGGIWVNSSYVTWIVSFYADAAAQHFIAGLFQDQRCIIASPTHRAEFMVERVEALPVEITGDTVRLRTLSPVVVSEKSERRTGRRGVDQYLHPADAQFGPLLIHNLLGKYESVALAAEPRSAGPPDARAGLAGPRLAGPRLAGAAALDLPTIEYELLPAPGRMAANPRSRLVTIKEGSPAQTQVRGYYNFDFALSGPPEVLELAVLAGVGRYNAEGFGCVGAYENF